MTIQQLENQIFGADQIVAQTRDSIVFQQCLVILEVIIFDVYKMLRIDIKKLLHLTGESRTRV